MSFIKELELLQFDDNSSDNKKLTQYDKERIEYLLSHGYTLYKKVKNENSSCFYRLSSIPFCILLIVVSLYMPFKWFINGKFKYDSETKFAKFMTKWSSKIK